jgi:hypothetical protein
MRNWILAAIIGLATCGQAWAWDDDYPAGGIKRIDEMETRFGPPSPPLRTDDRDDIESYLHRKRNYDEAIGRLQVYNHRKVERVEERQKEILDKLEEMETNRQMEELLRD